MSYSLRRIAVFTDEIHRRYKRELYDHTVAARYAQAAEGKSFQDFLKSLEDWED